jgi:dTDP-4-dehydrorhamnose reductase
VALAATDDYGVHHMAGSGWCSWLEFAREVFARAGVACEFEPGASADFPLPAARPAWSVLGSERGHRLPACENGLDAYLGAPL